MNKGELKPGEAHPAAYRALEYVRSLPIADACRWKESFASCAIEGNRLGEVCIETWNRLDRGDPVSDRYIMGLAIALGFLDKQLNEEGK